MSKYSGLCVDGPARGRLYIAPIPRLQFAELPTSDVCRYYVEEAISTIDVKKSEYHLHTLAYGERGKEDLCIWSVEQHLTTYDAVRKLMEMAAGRH